MTFHVFIKDLLNSESSITIHCFCMRKTVWTHRHLSQYPSTLRLWCVTEDFRCGKCGRIGKVRHIDLHLFRDEDLSCEERNHVRKPLPIREKPVFGKRRRPAAGKGNPCDA